MHRISLFLPTKSFRSFYCFTSSRGIWAIVRMRYKVEVQLSYTNLQKLGKKI